MVTAIHPQALRNDLDSYVMRHIQPTCYWPMAEQANVGLVDDLSVNGQALTPTGAPTPALVGPNGLRRVWGFTPTQYHTRASNATLQTGDIDFTVVSFYYLTDLAASYNGVCRFTAAGGNREYGSGYNVGSGNFYWLLSNDGISVSQIDASAFGAISATTWYMVANTHDSVNNLQGIQVNLTAQTIPYANGVFASAAALRIGDDGDDSHPFKGRIGPTIFVKRVLGRPELENIYYLGMAA